MMLAVPPVAAAARALAVAAAAGLVAADTHPPVTRAPATAAMASMAATRFLCMTNIPLHQRPSREAAGSSTGMRRHAVGQGRGARRSHRLDAALVAAGAKDQRDGEQPG